METLRTILRSSTIPHETLEGTVSKLSAGEKLYRTESKGAAASIVRRRTTRVSVKAASKMKTKTKTKERTRTTGKKHRAGRPLFFSSWQVAALYADDHLAFNTYTTQRDIRLLKITHATMEKLLATFIRLRRRITEAGLSATVSDLSDSMKIRAFLEVFGYQLATVFEHLTFTERGTFTSHRDFYRAWATDLMKDDPHIQLFYSYPDDEEHFNRVSLASYDYGVFLNLFTLEDAEARAWLDTFDGIHAPPVSTGLINLENLLNAEEWFPEEVFLRDTASSVITVSQTFDYVHGRENPVVAASFWAPSSGDFFYTVDPVAVTRIYLFTRIYRAIHLIIEDAVHRIQASVEGRSADSLYRKAATEFIEKIRLYPVKASILLQASQVLDAALEIDPSLSADRIRENPFYDAEGNFNPNLYTFTVLSTVIKRTIQGLASVYSEFGIGLKPVVSGGALFGVYTWGPYRRLTKDVDVKIVTTGADAAENGNEAKLLLATGPAQSRFLAQETLLWRATMANSVWLAISEFIVDKIVDTRLFVYANTVNGKREIPVFTDSDARAKWSVYAGANPTARPPNYILEFDRFLTKNYDAPPKFMSTSFNLWLQNTRPTVRIGEGEDHVTVTSLDEFLATRKRLLTELYDRKNAAAGVVTTLRGDVKRVEDLLLSCIAVMRDEIKTAHSFFMRFFKNMRSLIKDRPRIQLTNETDYGMGWFSSLYIHKATRAHTLDPSLTYGLVDFTFDTRFSTVGSFAEFSDIRRYGERTIGGVTYGSSWWLIHESIKLHKICNGTEYPGDNEADVNPENGCAPKRAGRLVKQRKYRERYEMVLNFFRNYLHPAQNVQVTLEALDAWLATQTEAQRILIDKELVERVNRENRDQFMVGAGR